MILVNSITITIFYLYLSTFSTLYNKIKKLLEARYGLYQSC